MPLCDAVAPALGLPSLWGWQRHFMTVATERRNGLWRYRTVVLIVSRQNGKTMGPVAVRVALGLFRGERIMFSQQDRTKGREKWLEIVELLHNIFPDIQVFKRLGAEAATVGSGVFKLVTPGPGRRTVRHLRLCDN